MLKSGEEKTKGVNLVSRQGVRQSNVGCRQKANEYLPLSSLYNANTKMRDIVRDTR